VYISKSAIFTLVLSGLVAFGTLAHADPEKLPVCVGCHGADGSGVGMDNVPIIAGTPAPHLEEALYAYQDGARHCTGDPAMCAMAATLSESEIMELAEYFSSMSRISSGEAFDETLAKAGELVHEEHCAVCHLQPDDEESEEALGIPLHGQRSAYLKAALEAYLSGDRDTLVPAMATKLSQLDAGQIEALINYYASYRP